MTVIPAPMRTPDRLRRLFLTATPWWDEREERARRRREAEARLHAIRARRAALALDAELDRTVAALRGGR